MARDEFDEFASGAVTRLYRTAFLMVGDHHLAEDLAQDVLARVYVAWPRVHGDPHGYAYRALANAAANQRRWRRRHPESELDPSGVDTPGASYEERVLARVEVVDALRMLPPRQRAVVVLRYFADLTEVQTAHALDVSTGTVKSQNAKALARLREVLGEDLDVSEPAPAALVDTLGVPEHVTATVDRSTS